MALLQDGLIAFLSAVGLTTVIWLVAGLLLRTGKPTIPGLLLAFTVEADVRELRRLRNQLPGAKIVLADCGMTEDARVLACYLAEREQNAELIDVKNFQIEMK